MDSKGIVGLFGLVAVIAIGLEAAWRLRTGRGYDLRNAAGSVGVTLGNLLSGVGTAFVLAAVFSAVWAIAPIRWPLDDWRTWAVGFLLVEFAYYWNHRLGHEVRWMWASHAVHHTTEEMNLLAAGRLPWTNLFSLAWCVYAPLVLAGFDPKLVFTLVALNLRYQFFIHTEAVRTLGPLEWVLNTPAHHRVHHASNGPYLDKNYGGVLIVFDRLFGTFAKALPDEPLRYGLTRPLRTANPFELAFCEWKAMFRDMARQPTWLGRLKVAIGRP